MIENAIIKSVSLSDDDHGGLSGWLHLEMNGSGQGFGGYRLYWPHGFKTRQKQSNSCGHFIWRCMQVGGVDAWEKLPGKSIRVRRDHGLYDSIDAIGHIVKDDWFEIKREFAELREIEGGNAD